MPACPGSLNISLSMVRVPRIPAGSWRGHAGEGYGAGTMFAEFGLVASGIFLIAGCGLLLLAGGSGLKIFGAVLAVLGVLTLGIQLWVYYRRWHDY